jgi:hypothetical protein
VTISTRFSTNGEGNSHRIATVDGLRALVTCTTPAWTGNVRLSRTIAVGWPLRPPGSAQEVCSAQKAADLHKNSVPLRRPSLPKTLTSLCGAACFRQTVERSPRWETAGIEDAHLLNERVASCQANLLHIKFPLERSRTESKLMNLLRRSVLDI